MCTATWLRDREGYDVYFNRDERRTRLPAQPPRVHRRDGISIIAPTDGDRGGSWIAVSQFGLSLCLLNYYTTTEVTRTEARSSRGSLTMSLADARSGQDVRDRLSVTRLGDFNPFVLLVMETHRDALRFLWDGLRLDAVDLDDSALPVTTSGFEPVAVAAARRATFQEYRGREGGISGAALEAYHRSQTHADRAYDVCMTRPESATVSFSHIRVSRNRAAFEYRDVDAEAPSFGPPIEVAIPIERV